jgi:TPR repeat protein
MKLQLNKLVVVTALAATQQAASAATVDDALKLYDAARYADAARVLQAMPDSNGRAKGMLCELYARSLVQGEPADTAQVCAAAAAAHDPHGLLTLAIAHAQQNPPAGITHDDTATLRYLSEAAGQNFPPAFDTFCDYFYSKREYGQAAPFCKVAAAAKLPGSMYRMAQMLFDGKGAVQNFDKGRAFALASARMNYAPAYALLGDQARDGSMGSPRDPVQAYAWYSLATSAAPDWNEPVSSRDALRLSGEQVVAAQKVAAAWSTQPTPRNRDFYRN